MWMTMRTVTAHVLRMAVGMLALWCLPSPLYAQLLPDEEHRIRWHAEQELSRFQRLPAPAPVTVASPQAPQHERLLTLDEAIRLALQYSEVIRVLTGTSATSSGRTIYDTAIATTAIDQAVARFDPVFRANSSFRHNETPFSVIDPGDPLGAVITDRQSGGTDLSASLARTNRLGGTAQFGVLDRWDQLRSGVAAPGSLDPSHAPTLELSYTQPLLAGAGRAANAAPIVIARLQQEQSYFQFKDSLQELVRGVIAAYWSLVQARTELWAREKQLDQLQWDLERYAAQQRAEIANLADVSQRRVAYNNARATLIAAQANLLQREAALRNLLGLPPEDGTRLVPSTPPTRDRVEFVWTDLVGTAQTRRPDLIELNLILLADQQRLIQGRNAAQPELNAAALQRWNGLSGRMLNGATVTSAPDDHTDWTVGVSFSVPVGLRQARAQLRSQELLIARDRANLQQSLHQLEHALATSVRSLDQSFLQYEAYRDTREAARINLEAQWARAETQQVLFLNVLLAITDWGNAVAAEAQSLAAYNTELASLERETGTILETHGIRFVEEQYASLSAWGPCCDRDVYPRDLRPQGPVDRYPDSGAAAEQSFDLQDLPSRKRTEPTDRKPPEPALLPEKLVPETAPPAGPAAEPPPARSAPLPAAPALPNAAAAPSAVAAPSADARTVGARTAGARTAGAATGGRVTPVFRRISLPRWLP